jgi:hypothetical protein
MPVLKSEVCSDTFASAKLFFSHGCAFITSRGVGAIVGGVLWGLVIALGIVLHARRSKKDLLE